MTIRPTQHPASTSDARKRAADLATPDWGSDLREPLDLDAIRARAEAASNEHDRLTSAVGGPGESWRWSIPANPERDSDLILAASLTDVPALLAEVERLREARDSHLAARNMLAKMAARLEAQLAEVRRTSRALPCDGGCVEAPEEDCSLHGREPAELWEAIAKKNARAEKAEAERDAAREALARVEALAVGWRPARPIRFNQVFGAVFAQPTTGEEAVYCRRCDFYTDHVSTAHDGLAARGLLRAKGEGLVVCADCGHAHTPDRCVGDSTPSDHWAGVTPASCDCPGPGATDEGAGA